MIKKSSPPDLSADPIHYRVDIDAPNTPRFRVTLTDGRTHDVTHPECAIVGFRAVY